MCLFIFVMWIMKKKIGGFHSIYYPTGDVNEDIAYIKNILKQFKGRFPEKGID